MAFNPTQAEDLAGIDSITSGTRVRASKNPVTFTDSTGVVTIAANPLGVNYVDGAGAPFTTSVAGTGTSITLGASQLLGGVIVMASATSSYTSITDTAAHIIAGMNAVAPSGVQVGDYLSCLIMNDSISSASLAMGANVSSANAVTSSIPGQSSRYCLFRVNTGGTSMTMFF